MTLRSTAGILASILAAVAFAQSASADPLVWVSVLGRVQGSGADYGSTVRVQAGQTLEYELVANLADIGTSAQTIDYSGQPVYTTIASLKGPVGTASKTYYDGIDCLKFNLFESAAAPIQIDLSGPTLAADWAAGLGHNGGTATSRGNGYHDIVNIRPVTSMGVRLGVPEDGVSSSVILAAGLATISSAPGNTTSYLTASDAVPSFIDGGISAVFHINGGIGYSASPYDADPLIGFNNLMLTTPEPATLALLALGGAVVAARGRKTRKIGGRA